MSKLHFAAETLELDVIAVDSCELVFLEDSSYEFVGGGDAVNGY